MKTTLHPRAAFTLVELMVGMSVLVLMFGFLMSATNQMVRTMSSTTAKVEQFRGARDAFERVTTRISQAALNTYWDYGGYEAADTKLLRPKRYERTSELRFLTTPAASVPLGGSGVRQGHSVFFAAPLGQVSNNANRGLENLLNVTGFFVEYGTDKDYRPKFIGSEVADRWRWRLMEYSLPAENFSLYKFTSGAPLNGKPNASTYKLNTWIVNAPTAVRPMVDNIIALVITPRLSKIEEAPLQGGNKDKSPLAPNYEYDSMKTDPDPRINPLHQLPPVVQVTMVAIDEKSAAALNLDASSANLFNNVARFKDTSNFTKDLLTEGGVGNSLEDELIKRKIAYRMFTSNVHLRASKWSREQTDIKNP